MIIREKDGAKGYPGGWMGENWKRVRCSLKESKRMRREEKRELVKWRSSGVIVRRSFLPVGPINKTLSANQRPSCLSWPIHWADHYVTRQSPSCYVISSSISLDPGSPSLFTLTISTRHARSTSMDYQSTVLNLNWKRIIDTQRHKKNPNSEVWLSISTPDSR